MYSATEIEGIKNEGCVMSISMKIETHLIIAKRSVEESVEEMGSHQFDLIPTKIVSVRENLDKAEQLYNELKNIKKSASCAK